MFKIDKRKNRTRFFDKKYIRVSFVCIYFYITNTYNMVEIYSILTKNSNINS